MLTIQVDGQLEQRLKEAAATAGAEPQVVARRLLDQSLGKPNAASLALLEEWEGQDKTSDPAELRRREEEGNAFMEELNRNRLESEGPSARKLWP
jgi:hypothetical protein